MGLTFVHVEQDLSRGPVEEDNATQRNATTRDATRIEKGKAAGCPVATKKHLHSAAVPELMPDPSRPLCIGVMENKRTSRTGPRNLVHTEASSSQHHKELPRVQGTTTQTEKLMQSYHTLFQIWNSSTCTLNKNNSCEN